MIAASREGLRGAMCSRVRSEPSWEELFWVAVDGMVQEADEEIMDS